MKALIQRVSQAQVQVGDQTSGKIGPGLAALIGIEKNDDILKADKLLKRILSYRVFYDNQGKMNLSLSEIGGGLLIVSQFTLAADTKSGTRAGFSTAKNPKDAQVLYDHFVQQAQQLHNDVATGVFGADMQLTLTNDGPVTFLLEC